MTRRQYFTAGFKDGIPICLGYIAVSFTFGIMAKKVGISIFDAVLISLTNVTSAGQFAGLSLIASTASYIEMGHHTAYYQLKILSDVLCAFAED